MRLSPPLRILPFLAVAVACSTQAPEASPEHVGTTSSAIMNGSPDTTHKAVVAMVTENGASSRLCTGTIVKVDAQRHIGWVATAAHCVTPVAPKVVIQSDDFEAPLGVQYTVLDSTPHPSYSGTNPPTNDFGMIRILGVDASTPVIPLTGSPDNVAVGTPVTSVGYGLTSTVNPTPQNMNKVRRSVQKTLDEVTSALIAYDMSASGICSGDSGGPMIAGSGANERLVGIHSYVTTSCAGRGYAGRIAGQGLNFYNTEMAKALPADSCAVCDKSSHSGMGMCAVLERNCQADPDCKAILDCTDGLENCLNRYPLAAGPYLARASCTCIRACKDQCATDSACSGVLKCGFKMEAGDCTTCVESSCCQEELDCTVNGQCYACLKNKDADASCATNEQRKALANCAASKCTSECAGNPIQKGADPPSSSNRDGGTASGDGAADGTAPADDGGCSMTGGRSSSSGTGIAAAFAAVMLASARRRRRV